MKGPVQRRTRLRAPAFGSDRECCQLCLREPAFYDPVLGIRICIPCLNATDDETTTEET